MRHVAGLRLIHELTPNPQPLRRTVQIPRIFEECNGEVEPTNDGPPELAQCLHRSVRSGKVVPKQYIAVRWRSNPRALRTGRKSRSRPAVSSTRVHRLHPIPPSPSTRTSTWQYAS